MLIIFVIPKPVLFADLKNNLRHTYSVMSDQLQCLMDHQNIIISKKMETVFYQKRVKKVTTNKANISGKQNHNIQSIYSQTLLA